LTKAEPYLARLFNFQKKPIKSKDIVSKKNKNLFYNQGSQPPTLKQKACPQWTGFFIWRQDYDL